MKRVEYSTFGPPSRVARLVDAPDVGAPSAWEVVVDVEAFPINPADLAMLAGQYGKLPKLPATIGMEGVGRVAQVGASVADLAEGDRVVILANDNWAERRKAPAAALHKAPPGVDVAQLAMLKVNPATAALLLKDFVDVRPGEWVLQTAPLSGVGRCVMQIARARGLRTVNVVRNADARPAAIAAGADAAVEAGPGLADRVREAVAGAPVRLALDAVAGPGVQHLAEALAEGGQVVNYGMLSGEPISLTPEQTIFRGVRVQGFWVSRVLNRLSLPERRGLFDELCGMLASGALKMPVDSTFPLGQINEALRRAEQHGRSGKVIVTVGA